MTNQAANTGVIPAESANRRGRGVTQDASNLRYRSDTEKEAEHAITAASARDETGAGKVDESGEVASIRASQR